MSKPLGIVDLCLIVFPLEARYGEWGLNQDVFCGTVKNAMVRRDFLKKKLYAYPRT